MLADNSLALQAAARAIAADLEHCDVTPLRTVPTGSAYYGKPNPADYDSLVHVSPCIEVKALVSVLHKYGWRDCARETGESGYPDDSSDYGHKWVAVRLGGYNAIITNDQQWFYRQWAAGELCRMLTRQHGNAMLKQDVIDIFRLIRGDDV